MRREETKLHSNFALILGLVLASAGSLSAGTIEGTVNASKPSDAVVYVEKVSGNFNGDHALMDQQNKAFSPYVLPVVQGATVEFLNSDSLQHNVFGVGADEFDLGNWAKGIKREHTFDKPGEVVILCNVHPEMEAYILVLENPYFAQLNDDGTFYKISVRSRSQATQAIRSW